MQGFLLVFVGAGLGGMARHGIGIAALRLGSSFPYATMGINILGSILMGLFAGWFALRGGPQALRLFIATGILGGFTTFSSYSLEAVLLLERGETGAALAYILGSVVLGLGGFFVGLLLMRAVL
ncbi:fluoride efflux transporter CrcB [Methylobacterium planeticum]|uniref:fluoride efflux transporter CrcB n=1 Tax=Methylobacterium planeticum TaxID=2615211 RepID=UPI00177F64A5|nr:fluoride efflux transporter CrcB [Methylobacterium planeticum]